MKEAIPFCIPTSKKGNSCYITGIYITSFGVISILDFCYSIRCVQCSCLENPRDGGAWWAAIYGVAQSRTRLKRLSSSSSIRCVVISSSLYLPCPDDIWCGVSFHMLICRLYIFLVRCPFLNQFFVFLLLIFKSSLYILLNNPLSIVCFLPIFSPTSVAFLFILLTGQKILISVKSSRSILFFMYFTFALIAKERHHQTQGRLYFLLCSILRVLWFCVLLRSFWISFCERCKVCV